ncbi:MAG: ribonuclease HII [Candidatus Moranbacteria bacterium]|nr:ribonuclease HII [Candidatus Moranbacteria bacterium]
MQLPTLEYEKKYWGEGLKVIVGIDEAGRGPLAGPVVAGAVVVLPEIAEEIKGDSLFGLIRDSKALSSSQRERAYDLITASFPFGIGWSSHETVDRVNILQAAFLAMKKAVSDLKRKLEDDVDLLLVDGRGLIPNISTKQENIIGGDKIVFSISAASIVAKVTRDRMMLELHEKFPEYGFARHKGYGTKFHFEMIEKHGPCEAHRKSFRLKRKKT